jgi:hypothetical protein
LEPLRGPQSHWQGRDPSLKVYADTGAVDQVARPSRSHPQTSQHLCGAPIHYLKKEIYQREVDIDCRTVTALDRFSNRAKVIEDYLGGRLSSQSAAYLVQVYYLFTSLMSFSQFLHKSNF